MKHRKSILVLVAVCTGIVPFAVEASEPTVYTLNPVVVTATRTPVKLNEAPANVSVVTGEELRKNHYSDLSQALRDVSDVYIANYGTGVGYESSNSFYINGNNNVVWMVDGVVMNSTGINAPLTALKNMNNIERIEILKGAASALYGSAAVGGVVNIITRTPAEGMDTAVRVLGGSYGQEQYAFSTEGAKSGWRWRVNYQKDLMGNYKDAHGLEIPQHLNAETRSFLFGRKLDDKNDVTFYYDKYTSRMMYADSNKHLDRIRYGKVNTDTWHGVWNSVINDSWNSRFTFLNTHFVNAYNDITTRGYAEQLTWSDQNNTLAMGFDWRQDKVNTMKGVKLTNSSYFIQDEWKLMPQWTLTPGVRLDHHSAFGSHTSPHVSLAYRFNDQTNAYVAYNEYFIAPSAGNLYNTIYGNPEMKPETGHSWEFGMNHQFSDTMAGQISYFTRSSKDKIGYLASLGKYTNFDTEDANGINLDLRKFFTPELSVHFGYTYTHVKPTPQRAENVDGYIPKHAVVVGIDYNREKWDAHLSVRGNIDRKGPQTADVNAIKNSHYFPKDTYWVADLAANVRVTPDVTVFGRVNNLFDVFYAEHSNARANWGGLPDEWWTAPGRNYQFGVEMRF